MQKDPLPDDLMKEIDAVVGQRGGNYGPYAHNAEFVQEVMNLWHKHRERTRKRLADPQSVQDDRVLEDKVEATVWQIVSKLSRLATGDLRHRDSWFDIGGYAFITVRLIDSELMPRRQKVSDSILDEMARTGLISPALVQEIKNG